MTGSSHGAAAAAAAPSSQRGARVLAIVGGGFSGVCLAIHLLRQPTSRDLRIVILEPRAELGAGVAYATRDYPYPLNVASGQMSLDAAQPDDFLEFARSQGIHATAADYLPRQVFGEYLRARFAAQVQSAPAGRRATHRRARVLQLRRADRAWELWLDDGSAMRADQVVLAVGNAPPAPLADCAALGGPHYIDDPWSIGAGAHGEPDSVLLLGSGLTMIDAALRLAAIRPRARRIHVLSRHGLLPLPQAGAGLPSLRPDLGPVLAAGSSVRRMLGALRGLERAQTAAGGDWRELLGLLRPRLPGLWQRMDDRQRARFLRHARAWWDVHRHRAPVGPLAAVRALERHGVLELHAGRLVALRLVDGSVEATWHPRGAPRPRAWLVDRVVNCTGPDTRIGRHPDPLVRSLLANGLIRADALALGIDAAPDGRVIGADGVAVDSLWYLGPWLRARDWEATAVPELRAHAARLAQLLAADR